MYEEVEKPRGGKVMSILIGNEEYPSDIRDVHKMISVEEGLKELIDFDNNLLFPYVEKLLSQLKVAVDPSPMAFLWFYVVISNKNEFFNPRKLQSLL